ncbi:MAG: helix-hairpin-helix domain-containing protein [Burkholderiaceae bacterium]
MEAEQAGAAAAAPQPSAAPAGDGDDLTLIEGIGPKIAEEVLGAAGIRSWAQLADTPVDRLRELLAAAGSRFAAHDPGTWPEQAALAARGDFEALEKLKAELDGGKRA